MVTIRSLFSTEDVELELRLTEELKQDICWLGIMCDFPINLELGGNSVLVALATLRNSNILSPLNS